MALALSCEALEGCEEEGSVPVRVVVVVAAVAMGVAPDVRSSVLKSWSAPSPWLGRRAAEADATAGWRCCCSEGSSRCMGTDHALSLLLPRMRDGVRPLEGLLVRACLAAAPCTAANGCGPSREGNVSPDAVWTTLRAARAHHAPASRSISSHTPRRANEPAPH